MSPPANQHTFKRRSTSADTIGLVSPQKTKRNPLGAGRKERVEGARADIKVTVRLTPSEHASYLAAANAAGVSLGEWLRSAAEARLATKRKRG